MIALHLAALAGWVVSSFLPVGAWPPLWVATLISLLMVAGSLLMTARRIVVQFHCGALLLLLPFLALPLTIPVAFGHGLARLLDRVARAERVTADRRALAEQAALRWVRMAATLGTVVVVLGGLQMFELLVEAPARRRSPEWWQVWHPWMDPLGIQGEGRLGPFARLGFVVVAVLYARLLWATGHLLNWIEKETSRDKTAVHDSGAE